VRRRLRAEHRQLAKQRQHAMLPGAARRGAAPVANKGRALLQNAQRMQADKVGEPSGLEDLSRGQRQKCSFCNQQLSGLASY
jgi:hypothetical protein